MSTLVERLREAATSIRDAFIREETLKGWGVATDDGSEWSIEWNFASGDYLDLSFAPDTDSCIMLYWRPKGQESFAIDSEQIVHWQLAAEKLVALEAENATLKQLAVDLGVERGRDKSIHDVHAKVLEADNRTLRTSWDELQRDYLRMTDERDRLRQALQPFAESDYATPIESLLTHLPREAISDDIPVTRELRLGHFRAARAALATIPSAGETA